jgi:Tol biopolymer transport system component
MIHRPRAQTLFSLSLVWAVTSSGALGQEHAAQPAQHPDEVLLFVSDRGGAWDIYSVFPDGSGLIQLTSDAGMNSGATLSPDGRRVAFNSDRSGNMEIWAMGIDGSNPVQLTGSLGRCSGAAWSPNGDRIAFSSSQDGGGIQVMGSDGSNVRRISPRGMPASSPAWSPDGSRIAFTVDRNHHSEIWVMTVDGSSATQITDTPEGGNQHPQWSPDGRWIAFNSWRNDAESSSDIWVVTPDGNEQRRLSSGVEMEEYPKWSPDGDQILFTVGNAALFTMAADGTDRRQVIGEHFFTAGDDWGRIGASSHP